MVSLLLVVSLLAASARAVWNPIISGFNPDPAILRVGEDYYVATSSFEFWPGIPIYHSMLSFRLMQGRGFY